MMDEVESNPDKFMRLKYGGHWKRCRERVARLIGAHVDECVLVPNAIHGVNTVLQNIDWKKGDVILKSTILIPFHEG
jgi:selenocysteine lyase/cysteine desulfurase